MRRNEHYPRPEVPAPRRGNSIVLVMGILVLLVIIATAFITRTHAGRVTSSVALRASLRDDNARAMAEMLAQEISMALFTRPIDPTTVPPNRVADSNAPRLSVLRSPLRYGFDPTDLLDNATGLPVPGGDGFSDYPYNFAPYAVVAFTNWPDPIPIDPTTRNWPRNPGGVVGQDILALLGVGEGNPIGNPGFGDARWLADIEPLRWDTDVPPDGIPDAFSHWRHMTNIAHANNGFRIVVGIHDVGDLNGDGLGQLVTGLSDPVEQWLAVKPQEALGDPIPIFNPITGNAVFRNSVDFGDRWLNWFSLGGLIYATTYLDPTLVPPNFYDLGDLDGNGIAFDHLDGDLPQDEFKAGSARHAVSSILADTDGDGFTDSFWFLAPTMTERGIRQVVAVRIIDNSAMLNANVATRFNRLNTSGATPADLALVGELSILPAPDNYNVGIVDNPAHHETVADPFFYGNTTIGYEVEMWALADTGSPPRALNYLQQIGVIDQNFILNPNFSTELNIAVDRLRYWQLAGLRPLEPVGGLTPFGFTEELELRMFNGQNYPWIASRFERAVQAQVRQESPGVQFLHANLAREESSEYLDQLSNRELMFDSRRKLTMYNGARNDEMPPWLWWRWELPTGVPPGGAEEANFRAQARTKLDLREPDNLTFLPGAKSFRERLAPTLLLALVDSDEDDGNSYFGAYNSGPLVTALTDARRLAAGLAANILECRDGNSNYGFVQNSSVPLPQVGSWGQDLTQRFLGMEKQPFLVEALIGHVYKSDFTVEPPDGYTNSGNQMIYEGSPNSTIVVVQIANPFDEVLNLNDFRLRVFLETGDPHEVNFSTALTFDERQVAPGEARTFYAIVNELDDAPFHNPWVNVLQLDATFSHEVNVTDPLSDISTSRTVYDSGDEERAIELVRIISSNANGNLGNVPVLIDRIDISAPATEDDFEFGETVENLANTEPEPFPDPAPPPFSDLEFPGLDIGDDTYWIQWVHVSREWDVEFNNNPGIQADERNPRYVFAARDVESGEDSFSTATTDDGDVVFVEFSDSDNFHFHQPLKEATTGFSLNFSMQMLQKDADLEQVGELLNVWMFGHLLRFESGPPGQLDTAYIETLQTFSEFMINDKVAGEGVRANRLTIVPDVVGLGPAAVGQVVGKPLTPVNDPLYLLDFQHAVPTIPAGARVLDAFVCESLGVNVGGSRFGNANGFTGKNTPGLININTAPPEVMRSAPHMARLVHEIESPAFNPFVRVPEASIRYRERFGDPTDPNEILPIYGNRGGSNFLGNPDLDDLRGERGFASLGELMLLTEPASVAVPPILEPNENWQIDFAGLDPFTGQSTQISTDVNDLPGPDPRDIVAEDAEELNLLFGGMSNMLSTRSDVFTVYFRVRSFIQNPTTSVWDATNPEFIVDDSRYVMLVDRSEVNHPNDKPKILYLEKLPK